MEGCCRLMLFPNRILFMISKKNVTSFCHSAIRSFHGRGISCSTAHHRHHLYSIASFKCHDLRSYSTSSKPPESPKNGQGIQSNSQEETGQTNSDSTVTNDNTEKRLSVYQRFKQTYKEHGKALIFVEVVTSIMWYGLFYIIVTSGVDVISLLEKMGLSESLIQPFRSSSLGDFVIAFLLYKLISPLRYTVTLAGTGFIIKLMRKRGTIPQVTESTKLRTLYKDSREEIKDKSSKFRERQRSRVRGRKKRKQSKK